jgi:hypothetical protein
VYDQLFHSLGIENHASYHYSSILQSTYIDHMAPVFHRAAAEGKVVIDAQNSYPMGKGAGPLAHPDLLKLAALDGVLYDLRVIIIYRDPVDAVLSAVRRFQNKEVGTFYLVVPCCSLRVASHLRFRSSQFTESRRMAEHAHSLPLSHPQTLSAFVSVSNACVGDSLKIELNCHCCMVTTARVVTCHH